MTASTLLIDIETSPIVGYTWGMYQTNVIQAIQPVKVICASWKWLGDDETHVKALCDYKSYKPGELEDVSLAKDLWELLDKADVVVAHNGDSFDIKIMNSRFVVNGLTAPSHYKVIDTLKVAKKYFRFATNKLDNLGSYLGVGNKADTGGFKTWVGCMSGDLDAWDIMKRYNVRDIILLEKVYMKLRPFMTNHPNLNVINPRVIATTDFPCGTCQSINTIKRGFMTTKLGRYQRYQCKECGSWSSGPYEKVA